MNKAYFEDGKIYKLIKLINAKKLEKNEFSFPDQENVKLTGSRRTASARAGGTSKIYPQPKPFLLFQHFHVRENSFSLT